MKRIVALALVLLAPNVFSQEKTLCSPDEKVVFSCQIPKNKKFASLCASKDANISKGYVQYRFGKAEKIEMQFPETKEPLVKNFTYVKDKDITMETFKFLRGEFTYELISGEDNKGRTYGTVIVNKSGKLLAAFDCDEGTPFANITPKQLGFK
jgi:hypothetical protein